MFAYHISKCCPRHILVWHYSLGKVQQVNVYSHSNTNKVKNTDSSEWDHHSTSKNEMNLSTEVKWAFTCLCNSSLISSEYKDLSSAVYKDDWKDQRKKGKWKPREVSRRWNIRAGWKKMDWEVEWLPQWLGRKGWHFEVDEWMIEESRERGHKERWEKS